MNKLSFLLTQKGIHYLLTRFGTKKMQQLAYDAKYAVGGWDKFADTKSEEFIGVVESYTHGGNICVIGCGTGGIVTKLSQKSYRQFLGIDLSIEAINVAKQRENENVFFIAADSLTYNPTMTFTVVVFEECLNYFTPSSRKKVVEKYLLCLEKGGVVIITISQPERYRSMFSMLRKEFKVIGDRKFQESNRHLLILGYR